MSCFNSYHYKNKTSIIIYKTENKHVDIIRNVQFFFSEHSILTFYFTSYIDPTQITVKVINGLYAGVTTMELHNLAAEIAATMTTKHPDYAILAARYKPVIQVLKHILLLSLQNWRVKPSQGDTEEVFRFHQHSASHEECSHRESRAYD